MSTLYGKGEGGADTPSCAGASRNSSRSSPASADSAARSRRRTHSADTLAAHSAVDDSAACPSPSPYAPTIFSHAVALTTFMSPTLRGSGRPNSDAMSPVVTWERRVCSPAAVTRALAVVTRAPAARTGSHLVARAAQRVEVDPVPQPPGREEEPCLARGEW